MIVLVVCPPTRQCPSGRHSGVTGGSVGPVPRFNDTRLPEKRFVYRQLAERAGIGVARGVNA